MTKVTAKVRGFARSFIDGNPIVGGKITVLEDENLIFYTDENGQFGPFEWPVGSPVTLVLESPGSFCSGYKTTQSATFIVPEEGFNDDNYLKNISFQVPSNMAYWFFSYAMEDGKEIEDPLACQITATITPPNTTMDDIPQGVEGVTVKLVPDPQVRIFYFDMFSIIHKTNPFVTDLKSTSLDGGVAFINVPPGDYTMIAEKDGVTFSEVAVRARPGLLVNVSPPHGPTMQNEPEPSKSIETNIYSFFNQTIQLANSLKEALNMTI